MMGPGSRLDWDCADHCVRYMRTTKTALAACGRPWECEGRIVADFIDVGEPLRDHLADLEGRGIAARRWPDLLVEAGAGWDSHPRMLTGRGAGQARTHGTEDRRLRAGRRRGFVSARAVRCPSHVLRGGAGYAGPASACISGASS